MQAIVIDTNIALDLLVFDDPATLGLKLALATRELAWLAIAAMRDELARVLGYPHIAARMQRRAKRADAVLGVWDAHTQIVPAAARSQPICQDPDDQIFIDLAVQHRCPLLSKDKEVLKLKKRLAFAGVTLSQTYQYPSRRDIVR